MSGQLVVVAPEAARWLGVEVPASATVVVGGVTGGVGTSTVARLLADVLVGLRGALVSPQVVDAGTVARAWAVGDEPVPAGVVLVVCGAHPEAVAAGCAVVRDLRARPDAAARTVLLVPVATAGTTAAPSALLAAAADLGVPTGVLPVPRSRALAAGGTLAELERRRVSALWDVGVALAVEVLRASRLHAVGAAGVSGSGR